MPNEFKNRVAAQRSILRVINGRSWPEEDLFGLSSKAIERWIGANRLDPNATMVKLVLTASAKLFFLANKSQEQISDEYKAVSEEVASICRALGEEVRRFSV